MKTENKKGASMALNVIVVAVICLIILAIMIYLVGKGTNRIDQGTSTCGGTCAQTAEQCTGDGVVAIYFPKCENKEDFNYCCKKFGE